tara:strand:+ start:1786 stop:2565 length:780 start_codon:yes stop_codon:yes gene_type:complete
MKAHQFVYKNEAIPKQEYRFEQFSNDVANHMLYMESINPYARGQKIQNFYTDFTIGLIVACFATIAILRSFYRKRLNLLLKTLINWQTAKQIIRYEKVYTHPVNIALFLIFFIITPYFFSLTYFSEQTTLNHFPNIYLTLAIGLFSFMTTKMVLHYFLGWLFNTKSATEEYLFQSSLINKTFGVFSLILACIYIFIYPNSRLLFLFGITILILLLTIQLIRGFLIGSQIGAKPQTIFLYLCTLEILPWLLVGKYISNQL